MAGKPSLELGGPCQHWLAVEAPTGSDAGKCDPGLAPVRGHRLMYAPCPVVNDDNEVG